MRRMYVGLSRVSIRRGILVAALGGFVTHVVQAQAPGRARPVGRTEVLSDLVLANHIVTNEGAVDGLGHVSARDPERPERFWLSRAMAPALVSAQDLMEYNLDGAPIDQQGKSMYGERFIHAATYKARPEVNAIVHCHTPSVLPFANTGVIMRPMFQMSSFLAAGAPVFEIRKVDGAKGMLVTNLPLGEALAATLGTASVVLMRGHGAVLVGSSIPEAVSHAIHLDQNAQMQTQAIVLGAQVRYLTEQDGAPTFGPYERHWEHWKLRLSRIEQAGRF
jgi:ribulose-5-phosphate 4-epimerase/fuculose-1-phosphate aldolase